MKALTDAELAQLLEAAILAEREACVTACLNAMRYSETDRERSMLFACVGRIRQRTIDGTVSNTDTRAHETPQPNRS